MMAETFHHRKAGNDMQPNIRAFAQSHPLNMLTGS